MNPLGWFVDRLADRYSRRTLARATVALLVVTLVSQGVLVWYFGSVGLSLNEMSNGNDDRTVVIDADDLATFERTYDPEVEEGWCLYGQTNDTHVRIDEVVHADPVSQEAARIEFTCLPETAGRVGSLDPPNLIGVAHSHPSHDESRISRLDAMTWGRVSPLVEVKGIYTEADGIAFFTIRSLVDPLEVAVRR